MKLGPLHRLAITAWAAILVAVAIATTVHSGKLYPTFVATGERFSDGQPLYCQVPDGQDVYRYSPPVAATLALWSHVPDSLGAILWRWLQAVAFLFALRAWSRVAHPPVSWPAMALLTLPLVAGNVFNAQLNPLVCALMLAGIAAVAHGRYNLAAAALAGATMVKVYPLALGLLLCVVEPRRFTPRLVLALAIGTGLPFALQSPEYVVHQFADWCTRLGVDDRTAMPIHQGYHDFQKLLRRWGLPIELGAYRVVELAAGCAAAALVWWGRRRGWDRGRQVQACAGLGFVWCTLFGPATESATYMLLAPMAAYAVVAVTGRAFAERFVVRGAYVLLLSVPVALWFPRQVSDPYRALIPQAHAALVFLAWILWRQVSEPAGRDSPAGSETCRHGWAHVPLAFRP